MNGFLLITCVVCILIGSIVLGVAFGFVIKDMMLKNKIIKIEHAWQNKILQNNEDWQKFHNAELERWGAKTAELVNKTYYDAVEERDKAWELRFKSKTKQKPPTN